MNMTALYSCFGVIFGLLILGLAALGVMQYRLYKKRREFEESKQDIAAPLPLEVCAEDVLLRIRNAEIDTIAPLFSGEGEGASPKTFSRAVRKDAAAESETALFDEAAISEPEI